MHYQKMLVVGIAVLLIFTFSTTANSQSDLPVGWEKCVAMIEKEVQNKNGTIDTMMHGTGFLFFDSTLGMFLITNRHILRGKDLILIRYNKFYFDPRKDIVRYHREPCQLIDKDSKPLWKGHPNSKIDVAAIKLNYPSVKVDVTRLQPSRFKNFDSLEVGEDVYFFGFPLWVEGLKGRGDFPILRSGIVSYKAFELTLIGHTYIDSAMFLIDGFSFGGNSGSPVLTRATPRTKASLIGIIKGHVPKFSRSVIKNEFFVVQLTGDTLFVKGRPDTVTFEQNTGLATAICADRIKETLEQFRTKESTEKE